tara:strand:+ start:8478 stop:9434 length:957 start_codon:yes stop_codon:yes gene_type:complete
MRVLHVVNAYPSESNRVRGIFIKEQIDSLNDIDIESSVFFIDALNKGKFEYVNAIFSLYKLAKNADVIHAHHVFCAFVCILSGARNKLVTSFLSDSFNEVMVGPIWLRKIIYKFVQLNSKKSIFKLHNDKIDEINNFYCPNAVDSDFFVSIEKKSAREKLGLPFNKKYALFISGQNLYRPEKRYDLFKAVLHSYSEKYGVVIDEIALDNASREELVLYYNAVDFYLLTSDFEGSPNAVKECLSCNTSVISRNVGSVKELLSGLSNSFVVDSEQPKDYHSSINSILTSLVDNNYRTKLKGKGLDKDFVANKLKEIYESI